MAGSRSTQRRCWNRRSRAYFGSSLEAHTLGSTLGSPVFFTTSQPVLERQTAGTEISAPQASTLWLFLNCGRLLIRSTSIKSMNLAAILAPARCRIKELSGSRADCTSHEPPDAPGSSSDYESADGLGGRRDVSERNRAWRISILATYEYKYCR
jgi:hypothetical protein